MTTTAFFYDLLESITERGRQILSLPRRPLSREGGIAEILQWCERLLSGHGEASGMALAEGVLLRWQALDEAQKLEFILRLNRDFGPDMARLDRAIEAYRKEPGPQTVLELHRAAEPRRQELIRRLNLAPNGIVTLVAMREALLAMMRTHPALAATDADFQHLFGSWFNKGFLFLRTIDWSTPAHILEKIIRYEAVHEIGSWEELRRRLAPEDRRCFAFFHPQLPDEPLIFVEVALTSAMPETIDELLREDRPHMAAKEAATAVFYSISNCHVGLRGISFGNFLIKQVVDILRRELPKLETFATLSPVPGFARWLAAERADEDSTLLVAADREALALLDETGWQEDADKREALSPVLGRIGASYLVEAKTSAGRPADPVARFHLGNGARLERINVLADTTPGSMRQAHGLMVNYVYRLDEIEENHERFAADGTVAVSASVKRLLGSRPARRPAPKKAGGRKEEAVS